MQAFIDRDIAPPELRIVNAHTLANYANGFDPAVTAEHASETEDFLASYIVQFYPDAIPHVQFTHPELEEVLTPHFAEDRVMVEAARGEGGSIQKALGYLAERGFRRGGEEGALQSLDYATAHPAPALFRNYDYVGVNGPDGVIKFGGHGEDNFNIVQDHVAQARATQASRNSDYYVVNTSGITSDKKQPDVPVRPRSLNLAMKAGGLPPYYEAGEHEVNLENKDDILSADVSMDDLVARYTEADVASEHTRHDLNLLRTVNEQQATPDVAEPVMLFLRGYQRYQQANAAQ
jgi:hypothetical protein